MIHPDTQGPLDICELLWGCEMFYEMYEEPELVHGFMKLITQTYEKFLDKWFAMYPNKQDLNAHWSFLMKGTIVLRDDSAMNLSPDFYDEFSVPYDQRLLSHFGGGAIHFCGRGDHYIESLASLEGLYAFNMSQPQYNDMEKIYRATADRGIKIIGFRGDRAREDVGRHGAFHHNLHS